MILNNQIAKSPIADPTPAMAATSGLVFERIWRPVRRWNLGLVANNTLNQVQQVKSAVVTSGGSAATAAQQQGTQGVPQPVQNLRITRTVISATQVKVSVAFTPNPTDRYFQGVSLNLTQGLAQPVQVITGRQSPITFVTTRSRAAASLAVQSVGAFGDSSSNPAQGFGISKALPLV